MHWPPKFHIKFRNTDPPPCLGIIPKKTVFFSASLATFEEFRPSGDISHRLVEFSIKNSFHVARFLTKHPICPWCSGALVSYNIIKGSIIKKMFFLLFGFYLLDESSIMNSCYCCEWRFAYTKSIKLESVNSNPSLLNECLWYDKLWGPSQRVVTLFFGLFLFF